jgi:HK97 family phage portal protein
MKLPNWITRSLENPKTPLTTDWLWDAFGARRSTAGVSVTPENSLEVTAVWGAVRVLSSAIAALPLHTYRHTDAGKDRAREHSTDSLLGFRPNPEMSSFEWRELVMAHCLLFGNAYCEIERNARGEPIALWPIYPTHVRQERIGDRRVYVVRVGTKDAALPPENVLHFRGFGLDGQSGLIPTSVARNAVWLAKAAEEFGSVFFGQGTAPSGLLTTDGKLTEQQRKELRESWQAAQGGLSNAQRVCVMPHGVSWQTLTVAPEHAQFLETRKFSVSEIARIFCIPPHLIGDLERSTYSNIEAQGAEFVRFSLSSWTCRFEQEINYKLFADRSFFAEFVLEGMLRGDSAARSEFYASALNNGWMSVNEVRERENLPRIPQGDKHYRPLNLGELGKEEAHGL